MNLSSEHPDLCAFIKGAHFDYVRLFQANGHTYLEGKGRAGCLIKVRLTPGDARKWIEKYQYLKNKGE